MPTKLKTWIKRTVLALPVFITLILLFYIFIVPMITGWAIGRALSAAGLAGAQYELRSVSLYRLDIADVRFAENDPSVVGAIAIDYTPWTLFEGRVRSVRLIGAQLEVKLRDGKLDFGGLSPILSPEGKPDHADASSGKSKGMDKTGGGDDEDLSIMPVDSIQLESASLIVDVNGWKYRLNATGTITKSSAPPAPLFDEPITRKIGQHLAIDFRIDSAMVPLQLVGWIAPDLDDADLSFHFGPQLEGETRPSVAAESGGSTVTRKPPFLRANISAREHADGPHYRVKVRAAYGLADGAASQADLDNFADLEFDSRFNADFSLASLSGSARTQSLAIGPVTVDCQTLIGVRDGRAALDSSRLSISGPAGWVSDASMSITGLSAGFPASLGSTDRNISLGFDFAMGFHSRLRVPGFLSALIGPTVQMDFDANGSASASADIATGQTHARLKVDRLLLAQSALDTTGWLGNMSVSAQGISLSRDDTRLDARVQSARLWLTRSREQIISTDLAVRVPIDIPEGTLLLEVGNPAASDVDGLFWEQQIDDPALQKLVLGRAVLRGRVAAQTTLPGSGTHRLDARIRLPLSLSMGVFQEAENAAALEGPVLVIPVAQETGDKAGRGPSDQPQAQGASQPGVHLNPATRAFLPEDRPRMQWQIDSSFLGLPGATAEDCRWTGSVEVKGLAPVVVHFPPTKSQLKQAGFSPRVDGDMAEEDRSDGYLRMVRIEPTRVWVVASARSSSRVRQAAQEGLASLSRIGFSAPPELELTIRPRSEGARLDQTDFDLKLTLPALDFRLSADDALRLAGSIKASVTPGEVEQRLSTRITPDVDIALESVRLKSYGIERLSGNLGWSSSTVVVSSDGVEVTGRLTGRKLNVSLPGFDFELHDGMFDLPVKTRQVGNTWAWPMSDGASKPDPGVISLAGLTYNGQALAPIAGEASFIGSRFVSRFNWEPLEGARLAIDAQADVLPEFAAQVKIDLPLFAPQNSFAIGQLAGTLGINRAQRVEISGKLGATAIITYSDGKAHGTAKINVDRLSVIDRLSAIDLNGLTGQLNFAELFPLRSEGGQKLSAWGVRINDIGLAAPEVTLTIESPTTVLIERTRAHIGTDGILGLTAFRLHTDKSDINTDLLVENVNISDLFAAFAKDKLRGDGGLWGRVPIIISLGSPQPLIIREGFLFARPGDTGWFEILDASTAGTIDAIAESVAVGEAVGKQQFDDIRAGIRGLKNFSYDKLTVNFEKRNGKTLAVVRASGKARGAGPMIPPLVPTITVENIDEALGTALNYWYRWTQPGASAPSAPSPLDELF